jgi:hypothetical protein
MPKRCESDQMRGKKSFPNHVGDEMLAGGSSHRRTAGFDHSQSEGHRGDVPSSVHSPLRSSVLRLCDIMNKILRLPLRSARDASLTASKRRAKEIVSWQPTSMDHCTTNGWDVAGR